MADKMIWCKTIPSLSKNDQELYLVDDEKRSACIMLGPARDDTVKYILQLSNEEMAIPSLSILAFVQHSTTNPRPSLEQDAEISGESPSVYLEKRLYIETQTVCVDK